MDFDTNFSGSRQQKDRTNKTNDLQENQANEITAVSLLEVDFPDALAKLGLTPSVWLKIFQDELSISSMQQLQHLTKSDVKKLMSHTNHDWEKRLLRSLIKDEQDSLKSLQNVISEANESYRQFTSNPEEVYKSLEKVQSLLKVPNKEWESKMQNIDLDTMISFFEFQTSKLNKGIPRKVLEDEEVIKGASGGLALMGAYVTDDIEELCKPRQTVIQLPRNINLRSPVINQEDNVIDISSIEINSHFHRGMDVLGFKLNTSLNAFKWKVGASVARDSEKERSSYTRKNKMYHSLVKYSAVPVKSCELTSEMIRLIPEAVKILSEIETLDTIFSRELFVTSECIQFFQRFGSHINTGMLHFGGIYKWVATYKGETKSSENVTKGLVTKSLDGYVNGFMPTLNIGMEVSAKYLSTKGNISQMYSETDLSNTTLKILKCGGPPEIDDFHIWKFILSSCNSTWSLIDRGNLEGIWKVIPYHSKEFADTKRLSKILEKAWESRHCSIDIDFTQDKDFTRMVIDSLGKIKYWIQDREPTACIELLEGLIQCKTMKIEMDGGIVSWMNILHKHGSIKQFIDIIARDEIYATTQRSYLKYLVREIMHPLRDERFSAWYHITKWSTIKDLIDLPLTKKDVKTIDDLLNFVKQKLLPIFVPSSIGSQLDTKAAKEDVTCVLAKACFYTFSSLDDRNDVYGILLLKSMLIKLKYDDDNHYFPTYLSEGDIKGFVDDSENDLCHFKLYNDKPVGQLQAFLILNVAKRLQEAYSKENTENMFDTYLLSIRHILDERISMIVQEHTHSSPYKSHDLQEDLAQLAKGKELVKTLFTISGIALDSPHTIVNITETETPSSAFNSFLKPIGLLDYFPNKISLQEILTKKLDFAKPEYTDIPWIFLKEMVMCNYNCRDKTLQLLLNRYNVHSNDDDDEDDWNSITDSTHSSNSEQSVNPLDLIMAVYMCCTPVMQQTMITNMFSCKLGIPFVLPPFRSETPLALLLWSMRQIFIDRKVKDSIIKTSAMYCPCQIVSFIRLSSLEVSKSNIINQLLSNSHKTFFNADCPLGNTKRCISNGMIEAAWHIPSTSNDNVMLFLNLRGNAMTHLRQTELLLQMSSILVVVIGITDIKNDEKIKTLTRFHNSGCKIVLAIDAFTRGPVWPPKQACQEYLKSIGNFIKKTKIVKLAEDGKRISLCEIADNILNVITHFTSTDCELKCLYDIVGSGISSDEELSSLHTEVLMKIGELKCLIPDSHQNLKSKIVHLQSSPWMSWSEAYKTFTKSSEFLSKDNKENSKQTMIKQRLVQLEKLENLHPFMRNFINVLAATSTHTIVCEIFLIHLKLILDETSNMDEIEHKYQSAVLSLRTAKQKPMIATYDLQLTVEEYERQLLTSSFGFEHLIREIGQIYEAVTEPGLQNKIDKKTKTIVARFPEICARIILMGQPFEIMDGDAANVPERWVKSVLFQLRSILGETKVWTLSVIGIQSSGKSTLLNTMFGLQFPVSAGRCTRGLFMQLVPEKDEAKRFDYILIIDTEGLRAEELVNDKHKNDNKLATFVIGLADTTIINIFGENPIAINDILQIVVISFLRLRQAQRKLQLQQGCVFVHQNVSALNAKQKLAYSREAFVNQLDNITKEAAENEHLTDISNFNQIIEFDSSKDVWYFPNLWLGALPMAPRNPEYSISVENLKRSLLNEKSCVNENFSTLHEVSVRIGNLWEAILSDDFVFNFRNCLELKAYNTLESQYQKTAYKLEQFSFTFTHFEARSELVVCDKEDELEDRAVLLLDKFEKKIIDQTKVLKDELCRFIDDHQQRDKMKEWEQNRFIRLKDLATYLTNKVKTEIYTLKEETMLGIQIHNKKYEQDLDHLAMELAHNLSKQPDDTELENIFDEQWIHWMMTFSSFNPKRNYESIKDEMIKRVYEAFFDITPLLNEYFDKPVRHSYEELECLEGSIKNFEIEERHIKIKKNVLPKIKLWRDKARHFKNKTIAFTNKLFIYIDNTVRTLRKQDIAFSIEMSIAIFSGIRNHIEEHNQNTTNAYLLNPSYRAMIVTHVAHYTTVVFEAIDKEYKLKHSPQAQLERYKPVTLMKFKGLVAKKTEDVIAADIFLESLRKIVTKHVSECLPIDIYGLARLDFPLGKSSIIRNILKSLAFQGNYTQFYEYINAPNQFAKQWLIKYINDKILSPKENGCTSEFARLAKVIIEKIFIQFSKSMSATLQSTAGEHNFSKWKTLFIENMNSSWILPFSRSIFIGVSDKCDVGHFTDLVMAKLSEIKEVICSYFECTTEFTDNWREKPVQSLMHSLWGCDASCPFCREPCKHSNKDHLKDHIPHTCIQHRITGAAGLYNESSWIESLWTGNKLMVETCNELVRSSDIEFCFNGELFPWKNYQKCFPDWDIESGTCNNDFWKWFVCNYKDEIKKEYRISLSNVPKSWKSISRQKAIDSLL